MEPQIQQTKVEKHPVHQITPLSKYLAMILFIILPFLGGWIGYTYAPEKVVEINLPPTTPKVDDADVQRMGMEIKNQILISDFEEKFTLPSKATVSTGDETIELERMQLLPGNLFSTGIYKFKNDLYTYDRRANSFTYIPDSDAATFEILPGSFSFDLYAKDKNHVYCRGQILGGADVATFEKIPGWKQSEEFLTADEDYVYYQDKDNQYVYHACVAVQKEP